MNSRHPPTRYLLWDGTDSSGPPPASSPHRVCPVLQGAPSAQPIPRSPCPCSVSHTLRSRCQHIVPAVPSNGAGAGEQTRSPCSRPVSATATCHVWLPLRGSALSPFRLLSAQPFKDPSHPCLSFCSEPSLAVTSFRESALGHVALVTAQTHLPSRCPSLTLGHTGLLAGLGPCPAPTDPRTFALLPPLPRMLFLQIQVIPPCSSFLLKCQLLVTSLPNTPFTPATSPEPYGVTCFTYHHLELPFAVSVPGPRSPVSLPYNVHSG